MPQAVFNASSLLKIAAKYSSSIKEMYLKSNCLTIRGSICNNESRIILEWPPAILRDFPDEWRQVSHLERKTYWPFVANFPKEPKSKENSIKRQERGRIFRKRSANPINVSFNVSEKHLWNESKCGTQRGRVPSAFLLGFTTARSWHDYKY